MATVGGNTVPQHRFLAPVRSGRSTPEMWSITFDACWFRIKTGVPKHRMLAHRRIATAQNDNPGGKPRTGFAACLFPWHFELFLNKLAFGVCTAKFREKEACSFAPASRLASSPRAVMCHAYSPLRAVRELVARCRPGVKSHYRFRWPKMLPWIVKLRAFTRLWLVFF